MNSSTETKTYHDGTVATGVMPLPEKSPAEQAVIEQDSQLRQPVPHQNAQASPDMMQMFRLMLEENRNTTIAAIQEMKKLSPEDQDKLDREKQNLIEATMRRVEAAKLQEAEIADRQESCGHVMPNGQTNFRGQVNSNGWAHVFCSHCHKSYEFQATDVEQNKSGLNVDKWGPNAHTIIRNRANASLLLTPPPVPRVPAGATIIF